MITGELIDDGVHPPLDQDSLSRGHGRVGGADNTSS